MTQTDAQQKIAAGYATDSPAITLGSVMVDGTADPTARVALPLSMVNRHGLIAGATGTGKTKTIQLLVEQLSGNGVPVVVADIKGDVSGLAAPGQVNPKVTDRAARTGVEWEAQAFPVSSSRWAPAGSACRSVRRSPTSGPSCCPRCSASTRPRSRRSA